MAVGQYGQSGRVAAQHVALQSRLDVAPVLILSHGTAEAAAWV